MSKELDAQLAALIERCDETDGLIDDVRWMHTGSGERIPVREYAYEVPVYEIARTMSQETTLTFAQAYESVLAAIVAIRDANKEART